MKMQRMKTFNFVKMSSRKIHFNDNEFKIWVFDWLRFSLKCSGDNPINENLSLKNITIVIKLITEYVLK